ncbi:MAG TPA: hypothetical protein PLF40_03245, partial [Kofleriaceae bacterium]|nr:hypothetical protein [Kofleriaceae bacterium]
NSNEAVGLGVRGTGEAIEPIRRLTEAERVALDTADEYLGFYYQAHGIGSLDIYRSNGEFVLYRRGGASNDRYSQTVATYAPLTATGLEAVGNPSKPWRYHITPGMLLIIAFAELGFATSRNVTRRFALIVAVVAFGIAAVLYLKELTIEAIVSLAVGAIHAIGYAAAGKRSDETTVEAAPDTATSSKTPAIAAEPPRPSPAPRTDLGPFRASSGPQLAIERPSVPAASKATPIVVDDKAPPPSILR